MGPKDRRERLKQETREKILDAARELFVEHGYDAVTMRKLAGKIEYSPTAIYVHFKDKEALLQELCDHDFAALARQFAKIARVADPVERLRQTGRAYAAFGLKNPNHYRLMFMTPRPPMDPEDSQVAKGDPGEDAYAFLVATIKECLATNRFREDLRDADLVAQTVWSGVHGVVSLHITQRDNPWIHWRSAERTARFMTDLLVDGLLVRA